MFLTESSRDVETINAPCPGKKKRKKKLSHAGVKTEVRTGLLQVTASPIIMLFFTAYKRPDAQF